MTINSQYPQWFFLYFISIELLFKTQQNSIMIEFQNLVINEIDGERSNIAKHSITYQMFSNVRSLTMEENS